MHDAPAVGKARDHDVEEAADDEAKEETRCLEEQGREHDGSVQDRGLGTDRIPEPDMARGRGPYPSLVLLISSEVEPYGTLTVVPSPLALMVNIPALGASGA